MGFRLKRRWSPLRMGSTEVRFRKYAEKITTQQQLDTILQQVDPKIAEAWLQNVSGFLKFTPRQFEPRPISDAPEGAPAGH